MVDRTSFYEAVVFCGDNNAGKHRQKRRERIKANIDAAHGSEQQRNVDFVSKISNKKAGYKDFKDNF